MLRRSRCAPAAAGAATAALAAALWSVPAPLAGAAQAKAAATTISVGATPTFTALAFPAPAVGWLLGRAAAGGRAEIWHTGTAGATWQVQWEGAGGPLSITATDPSHAWALIACPTTRGAKQSCGRELLATADGGRRWRVAATLPGAVNQVQFASAHLGVATSDSCLVNLAQSRCPGRILVSRDGGAHWTAVLSSATPVFATASGGGQLWAAQTVPSIVGQNGPSASDITFLTSTDGGRSWRRLGQAANVGPFSPEVRISLAATASGSLTWASVFDPLSCAMHGCDVADLLRSGTGGQSWSQAGLADSYPDECVSNGIAFSAAPDGSAWAATGRNGAACAPPLGLLYRYGAVGWDQLPPWPLAQVSSLAAVSQDVAYAITDRGVLTRTQDGGMSWTQLLPVPAPAGQVDAVTPTTALAAQDQADAGAILRSDNGGRSWRQVAHLPGVVTQLDFWDANDGVAATYQPDATSPWQLWDSSDGGSIWEPFGALPGGTGNVYGPWMSANGQGLLLTMPGGTPWEPGSGGLAPVQVWTTSNTGLNWARDGLLPLGRDSLAGPASFTPDPGPVSGGTARWTGWLVIDTASYAQRVAAWSGGPLSLLPASVPGSSVQLISPEAGLAWSLDYPGNPSLAVLSLARTTDSGRHWQRSSIRLGIPASSLAAPLLDFTDASHGWLVLGSATWHTADGGRIWTPA
ncbi:MAG TPA: hypothetical protein VGS06_35740 [Streptosporangiaceae bacterium]|nr:hypothetical protein [Streptosporangiaceae bacterium]